MKARLILAIALLLCCTGAGAALAQGTPDGQPPASETVCDMEKGAAFGLCNAYCEAMDCDSANPQASATACTKVRNKFQQTTGHDVPCEVPKVTCPCNNPAVNQPFADTVAGLRVILTCSVSSFSGSISLTLSPFGNAGADPSSGACGAFDGQTEATTLEEGQLCFQLLAQAAANQGVPCVTVP
jgi:hypothetical protein